MGTYTTNYQLYMPTVGETGWGALINENYQTIDTTMKGLSNRITAVENEVNGNLNCTSVTTSGKVTANGGLSSTTGTFSGAITGTKGTFTMLSLPTSINGILPIVNYESDRFAINPTNSTSKDISAELNSASIIQPESVYVTLKGYTIGSGYTTTIRLVVGSKQYEYSFNSTAQTTVANALKVPYTDICKVECVSSTSSTGGVYLYLDLKAFL